MTVAELIKKLEDYPQDIPVFVPLGIDWEEITDIDAESDGIYLC